MYYSFVKFQGASAYLKKGEIPLFESRTFYIRQVHILATSTRRGVDEKDLGAERWERWRMAQCRKAEGEDLVLSHRGMPASYFRPLQPPFAFCRDAFTRRKEIMKKGALCCRATILRLSTIKKKNLFSTNIPLASFPFPFSSFLHLSQSLLWFLKEYQSATLKGILYDDEERCDIFRA